MGNTEGQSSGNGPGQPGADFAWSAPQPSLAWGRQPSVVCKDGNPASRPFLRATALLGYSGVEIRKAQLNTYSQLDPTSQIATVLLNNKAQITMKKTELIIQTIIDYVKATRKPIYYLTLARKVGLMPKQLFAFLKRIGDDAIANGGLLWDAWVAYDNSDIPAAEFFLQKIEAGYLKVGEDWIEFLQNERQKSLSAIR